MGRVIAERVTAQGLAGLEAGTDPAVLLKLIVRLVECRLDPAELQIPWVHEGRHDTKLTPANTALADLIRQRTEQATTTHHTHAAWSEVIEQVHTFGINST
jgi:hypothetical protein